MYKIYLILLIFIIPFAKLQPDKKPEQPVFRPGFYLAKGEAKGKKYETVCAIHKNNNTYQANWIGKQYGIGVIENDKLILSVCNDGEPLLIIYQIEVNNKLTSKWYTEEIQGTETLILLKEFGQE